MRPAKVLLFALLTAALVLAGCGYSTPVALTDTPTSTATPRPTYLPTITKHYSTPLPTNTPRPPNTQSPAQIMVDLITSLTETAQTATLEARATSAVEFSFNPECRTYRSLISPDNKWLAIDCPYDYFAVVSRDGTKQWKVPYKDMFSDSEDYPNNAGGVYPYFWTPDSQYIYFTEYNCCWDGPALAGSYGDLYRLDVQTGAWHELISGIVHNYYSFSPTGRRMIFISEFKKPLGLNVLDLQTGETNIIPISPFEQAAYIAWSPDGTKFAVTAITGDDYQGNTRFSVFVVDPNSGSKQFLIFDSDLPSYSKGWTEDNKIIIYVTTYGGFTNKVEDDKYLYFDVETNQFVATPTFTP